MFDVFYLANPTGLFPHERQVNSVEQACELSRTRYLWIVDGLNDYSQFDWTWEPSPWQSEQTHVWPSQHQENGGTWLIPKSGIQDVNRNHNVITRRRSVPRLHIKHCADSLDQGDVNTRFISNYLGTLRRALQKVNWQWCWVTADVCDYSNFDWSWHPSEWQQTMLHVFASSTDAEQQQFGDTFYVHVPTFLANSENLELLEWFDTLHFVPDAAVPRLAMPSVQYNSDSLVDAVRLHDFQNPLVEFYRNQPSTSLPAVNLWRQEMRAVAVLNSGASCAVVPRDAKNFVKSQMYDYPVIDRTRRWCPEPPLDVIFISNGEHGADYHYTVLQMALQQQGAENTLHHVANVKGRVASYQTAARASKTDWFFAVFAKIQVNEDFDWGWQPDRLQAAKHYIFHAYNPVNDLIYGHQAVIAYNRKLVLANAGQGLDFTMDDPHEVVPVLSGTAYYDNDAWTCWRTAFREALKLRYSLPDVENEYRLERWLAENNSDDYAKWSHIGAQDAMEYYDSVNGNFDDLKKSYDWEWLASYAMIKRPGILIC